MAISQDLEILQGKTFSQVIRWEADTVSYKPITAITQAAPAAVTSTAHGLVSGWRVAVVSVKGMTQINADDPPKESDLVEISVQDVNTVQLKGVNSSGYKAYTSGGYLRLNDPVDLSNCTVRMKIKTKAGGTLLASTEVGDAPLNIITATVNNTSKTITIGISATNTAALTWKKGVYDIEADISGTVTLLASGAITVTPEITTT